MKEKKIFDAITNVHDNMIEEAKVTKLKNKNRVWYKWTALAACAVLVLGISLLVPKQGNESPRPCLRMHMLLEKQHPK